MLLSLLKKVEKIERRNSMKVMLDTNILISAFVFKNINIDKPEILTATEFLNKY